MNGLHVKYVLIGGGLASSSAAEAIRGIDHEGAMLLVGQEVNRPYHRPALSKDYLLGKQPRRELFTLPDDWFARNQVMLHTHVRATALDAARHTVTLDNGQVIAFDRLLIATGGSPRHLKVAGADLPNVFYLRTIEDADRIHNAVEKALREGRPHDRGRGRAAVIGGGLLGVELAGTLHTLGLAVDLLMPSAHAWPRFAGETVGRFAVRHLESRGIRVHAQTLPLRLEGDGRVQRMVLPDQSTLECDLVLPALGINANKDLLRGTSIAAEKAILVDEHCRTSDPLIYAAGDCAAVYDPRFGKYRHLDHWDSAIATGRLAGQNMAGADTKYDTVNHFTSEALGLKLSVWGEARHTQRRIVRGNVTVESPDFLEIGVTPDSRITQVVAVNHEGDDAVLCEFVRRRLLVDGNEAALRDPATDLADLLR
jgi:3-phenylpropionate/trans-cinnamate dioxygenase ferredoxin reductase subunit